MTIPTYRIETDKTTGVSRLIAPDGSEVVRAEPARSALPVARITLAGLEERLAAAVNAGIAHERAANSGSHLMGERERIALLAGQRDGWREIAAVLIRIAFDADARGFGDTPPREILETLRGTELTPGDERAGGTTVTAEQAAERAAVFRDAFIGRAWRVHSKHGSGEFVACSYVLCRQRGKGIPLANVELAVPQEIKSGPRVGLVEFASRQPLRVCSNTPNPTTAVEMHSGECYRWALWVQARARAGLIDCPP